MLHKAYRRLAQAITYPEAYIRDHRLRRAGIIPEYFHTYNLPWLTSWGFNVVLDIGAARGSHTLLFHRLFPNARILAFEPHPESFSVLRHKTAGLPNIECYQCALSDREGMSDFHLGGPTYANSSSLLPMGSIHQELWPGSGSNKTIKVQTRRLDSLFAKSKNERVFAKMDIQGGEIQAIKGGTIAFSAVDVIVTEASMRSLYTGGTLFHDLYHTLCRLDFEYAGALDQSLNPSGNGEVIQSDIIFRRRTPVN
jgi:FkbM family methyltransferase